MADFIETIHSGRDVNLQGSEVYFKLFFRNEFGRSFGGPLDPLVVKAFSKTHLPVTFEPEVDPDDSPFMEELEFNFTILTVDRLKVDLTFWQPKKMGVGNHTGNPTLETFERFLVSAVKTNPNWFAKELKPYFYGLYWHIFESDNGRADTPVEDREDKHKVFHLRRNPKAKKPMPTADEMPWNPTLWGEVAVTGFQAKHKASNIVGAYHRVTFECLVDFQLKQADLR